MPKTLHVLGAGEWQVPTIKLAKSLGHRVFVTDVYPQRPGYQYADSFEVVDITDREKTLTAAISNNVDGIVCDTTDVGVPTAAWVAEKLGLPGMGYATSRRFTNKFLMRQAIEDSGIRSPRFRLAHTLAEAVVASGYIKFPLVIKPTDSQSSRGVFKLADANELEDKFAESLEFSLTGEVIVEQYLPGIEITIESIVADGAVHVVGISDKAHLKNRPEIAFRLTYPADLPSELLVKAASINSEIIGALGLKNGICHAEYKVDVGAGTVDLVEIAARGGGSRVYSDIVPYLAGFNIPERYIGYCLTGAFDVEPLAKNRAANLEFLDIQPGRVVDISGLSDARAIDDIAEIHLDFAVGSELSPPQDDRARPGFVLALGSSRAGVLGHTQEALGTLKISIE